MDLRKIYSSILVFFISIVFWPLLSARTWEYGLKDEFLYHYAPEDKTVYIVPLSDTIFIKGVLDIKDKTWIELVVYYDHACYNSYIEARGDNLGGLVFITDLPPEVPNKERCDTIDYIRFAGETLGLSHLSLWDKDRYIRLNIGGFKIGDSINYIKDKLGIVEKRTINRIVVGNYANIYTKELPIGEKPSYFETFSVDNLPYDEATYNIWEYLPGSISYVFKDGYLVNVNSNFLDSSIELIIDENNNH